MADFDKSKFDPKAAAEARKQEMDQMAQKLEAGVKDVFQGENYKAYLDFCAKMPRYSINNQILIMMQKPDATMCQSFTGSPSLSSTGLPSFPSLSCSLSILYGAGAITRIPFSPFFTKRPISFHPVKD